MERLFPFVRRTRTLLVGRRVLLRSKARLHFVLIPRDISPSGRAAVLKDFAHYPVVQHFTTAELERFFDIRHVKVVGFAKSALAKSLYAELRTSRINQPVPAGESGGARPASDRRAHRPPGRKSAGQSAPRPGPKPPPPATGAREPAGPARPGPGASPFPRRGRRRMP